MKKRLMTIILLVVFSFGVGCASTYKVNTTMPAEYQQSSPETK